MKYILLFVLPVFLFKTSFSQTQERSFITATELSQKFVMSNVFYTSTPTYSFNISYKSYESANASTPFDEKPGFFIKNAASYYSELLGVVTIQNEKFRLTVDSSNRFITISGVDSAMILPIKFEEFNQYLKMSERIAKKTDAGCSVYFIEMKYKSPISSYEITIEESGFVSAIVLYYSLNTNDQKLETRQNPRLEIRFMQLKINPDASRYDFRGTKYIKWEGDNVTLNPQYRTYKLIDNRIRK